MTAALLAGLCLATAVVALVYSSVGQAGASGYIALLALCGVAPSVIKPTALVLNVVVAALTTWQFHRAGCFSRSLFWPLAASATPFAFVGGYLTLSAGAFRMLVGSILLFSAARLAIRAPAEGSPTRPTPGVALVAGAGLGLLSGLTGTGGGIFLTPLLLAMRWASAREAAGLAAPFILLNSIAGLAGDMTSTRQLPLIALPLAVAALAGGAVGARLGSTRLPETTMQLGLAVVLVIAGVKLMLGGG